MRCHEKQIELAAGKTGGLRFAPNDELTISAGLENGPSKVIALEKPACHKYDQQASAMVIANVKAVEQEIVFEKTDERVL